MKKIVIFVSMFIFMFAGTAFAVDTNVATANVDTVSATAIGGPQTQIQGQVSNNTINFPAAKDVTTTRIDAKGYRSFPNQGEIHYPGHVGYFGKATPGSSFQNVRVLLSYQNTFNVDQLKLMAKGPWGSTVIANPLVKKADSADRADELKAFLRKPAGNVKPLAFITVKATSNNTTSAEIIAEALLEARKYGANAVQITAEGVERELTTFSWGLGVAYSYASINANEDRGGIGSGGTGIAGGKAGYKDRPWLRVIAIYIGD